MIPLKIFPLLLLFLFFSSCSYKNSEEEIKKYASQFQQDTFAYTGQYFWGFNLMGGEQVSVHTLYPDSITYTMTGKVYATNYTMKKLSYEKSKNKWIGVDENKIVYVLFFKEKTDSTVTIYKHKCKTNGVKEALAFDVPQPDATDDHGWNVYALNQNDTKDVLPLFGHFSNTEHELIVSDSAFVVDTKKVTKMSYHSGERRWVGKYQDKYLLVFIKKIEERATAELSITWFSDLEKLYHTKYNSVKNWEVYAKR